MTIKILLEILWRYWHWAVIALLVSIIAFVSIAYRERGYAIDAIKAEQKLVLATDQAAYLKQTRQIERDSYAQQIEAVNEYKKREQVYIAAAADSRTAATSLYSTVDKLNARAKIDADFRDRYLDTSSKLFKECIGEYSKMGEVADRLSNNLRLSQEANKRK